jgi:2',3'-cyclic-nucleotide 2'-phosphodiesterase (5'-nucleotidase family)
MAGAARDDGRRTGARHELAHRARPSHVLLGSRLARAGVAALALAGGGRGAKAADAGPPGSVTAAAPIGEGPEVPPPRGRVVSLVYTSNVGGEYERCGCAVQPLGGLARRAAELRRIRQQSDAVVSVDAGDLFLPAEKGDREEEARDPRQLERRARLLATAYARMGVAAFTPGERDLALGVPRLARVLRDAKVPTVSANLVDLDGKLIFPADVIVDAAGVKIGIFGVTAAPAAPTANAADSSTLASSDQWRAWGVVARDPIAAARTEVSSLRERGARIVVALVHVGGPSESQKVIAAVPGIDWVILGHSGRNLETPELVEVQGGGAGARELEAMSLGRNLGRLDLHVVSGDGSGLYADRDETARLRAIRTDHENQLADYKAQLSEPLDAKTRGYTQQRIEALRAALERDTRAIAARPARITGNWFENRIVPLDLSLRDDPEMRAMVERFKRSVKKHAR